MNTPNRIPCSLRLLLIAQICACAAASAALAQIAPATPPTAATLAKYDTNKNGRLDPEEVAAMQADEAKIPAQAATPAEKVVELSPFEVAAGNDKGYHASNTMSGTRLNSKIEDLGSSISVVTKQQMADFAMLDINDIFAYETSTEGTGNYTAFDIDRNGMLTDQIQNNPQGTNRVRGVGAANISLDGFATSGRVPVDPINIDAVEISRGPNSSIFGLGSGSGTVNMVGATANVSRESSHVEARFDDLGGWRTSLDLNRPLIREKLALRLSGVYQHEEARQKPSGFDTRRFNAMVRYQPFRDTSVRASFSSYRGNGTRANTITPRDAVSYWQGLGSPTWDPITSTVTVNGVATVTGTTNPAGLGSENFAQPILYVDGGIKLWEISRLPAATATDGPNNTGGTQRLLESIAEPIRTGRPLFSTLRGLSNKAIFDYSKINLGGNNVIEDRDDTSTVEIDQYLLNKERHKLALQFGWQREDADRSNRNVIGQASATAASYYLYIDPNTKLLDGTPNPFFGKPYIGVGEPILEERPYQRDSYRAQAAYILDYSNSEKWTKWIGRQQLLGYYEERKSKTFRYRFRDVMVTDNPIYAPAGRPKGNQSGTTAPLSTRGYYHFYLGDNNGQNIDYSASPYSLGNYTFNWYNPATSAWVADNVTLGRSGIQEGTAGGNGVLNLIKTKGVMLQSTLFQDRLITTFGRREDRNYNRNQLPARLLADGWHFDYAAMGGWAVDNDYSDGDGLWALRSGKTKTSGAVAKPFHGWNFIERERQAGGARGFVSDLLGGMTIYYNKSDSFRPETPAIGITLKELPNPSSIGKDYGFSINLGDKLVLRVNKYETKEINSRSGDSATLATRTGRLDFAPFKGENDAISLQRQARNWITTANPSFTTDQINAEVAKVMQLPEDYLATINSSQVTETSDVIAKGYEYELSYNPNRFWTVRANLAQSKSISANLSPNIPAWLAVRIPVWETIIDPRTGTKWLDTGYSGDLPNPGSGTPRAFLNGNVINPLNIARAMEGKSRPQVREWRFNLATSYQLAGLTEQKYLKQMSVGGGLRWESKGAIGFYGIPVNGNISAATSLDPDRPIYDKAHTYVDLFATYNLRLFKDKVRARLQLNVKNVQESRAHLQPVGAYPDGEAHTFRIIDPRTYIFTASFDL